MWGDTPAGVHSYWLEFSRGQLRIAGEASGALFLVGGRIYRWHQEDQVQHVLNQCPDDAEVAPSDDEAAPEAANPPANSSEITVVGAEAESVDDAGRVPIVAPPTVENATLFSNSITLRASAGPYVFIENCSDAMYCGAAHGLTQSSLDTFDLAKQKFLTSPTKSELSELSALALQTQRTSLLACLAARFGADSEQLRSEQLSQLEAWSGLPVLSATGKLRFEVQLAMMRSYVEGIVSCPVTVEGKSASLSRFAPPRGLSAFSERTPKTQLRGWSSLLPTELSRVSAISRFFAQQAESAGK